MTGGQRREPNWVEEVQIASQAQHAAVPQRGPFWIGVLVTNFRGLKQVAAARGLPELHQHRNGRGTRRAEGTIAPKGVSVAWPRKELFAKIIPILAIAALHKWRQAVDIKVQTSSTES